MTLCFVFLEDEIRCSTVADPEWVRGRGCSNLWPNSFIFMGNFKKSRVNWSKRIPLKYLNALSNTLDPRLNTAVLNNQISLQAALLRILKRRKIKVTVIQSSVNGWNLLYVFITRLNENVYQFTLKCLRFIWCIRLCDRIWLGCRLYNLNQSILVLFQSNIMSTEINGHKETRICLLW